MDNGSVNVSAHGISFSVRVNVTFNKTNGHFGINITDCSFGLDRLHLIFSGGARYEHSSITTRHLIILCFHLHHVYIVLCITCLVRQLKTI